MLNLTGDIFLGKNELVLSIGLLECFLFLLSQDWQLFSQEERETCDRNIYVHSCHPPPHPQVTEVSDI
jgi:hypothetical protein